jgi:predicted deacylase
LEKVTVPAKEIPLRISGIEVKRGTRRSGTLSLAERPAVTLGIPITVIRGSRLGKTMCLIAGVHGCEYVGIETALRISRNLSPKQLKGTLVVVPIVNLPAFQTRTPYVCPIDNVNINRVFPGKRDGSISHRIADTLFREVISKSDYLIDLHGGDAVESLHPITIFSATGNRRIDKISRQLCSTFKADYVVETKTAGTSCNEAAKAGIPAMVAEAGEKGLIDEKYVSLLYEGVHNAMRYLGMIPGRPDFHEQKMLHQATFLYADNGGLFYPNVPVGTRMNKGAIIGTVRNIHGQTLQTITAPAKSVVLCESSNPVVDPGSFLAMIAYLEPARAAHT